MKRRAFNRSSLYITKVRKITPYSTLRSDSKITSVEICRYIFYPDLLDSIAVLLRACLHPVVCLPELTSLLYDPQAMGLNQNLEGINYQQVSLPLRP